VAAPKKNALRGGWLVFIDESGFCESGVVRHTWAPRGKTPVLRTKGRNWKRMSAIGALAYRADGLRSRLFLRLKRGPVMAEDFVHFLQHLSRHLNDRVVVIWDRLNGHRSVLVREWTAAKQRFALNFLPAYAPELNPVETLWSWLKGTCLANCSHDDLEPLAQEVRRGARRARRRRTLLSGFRRKAGLFFGTL
jgi:transposase